MAYHEQLERLRRFLKRAEANGAYSDSYPNIALPTERRLEFEDMLYGFFQNCWHLKDWILNDSAAPPELQRAVKDVDTERAVVESLMLSADVANGSKHLKLDRHIRRGAKVESEVTLELTDDDEGEPGKADVSFTYDVVDENGKSRDALELARQALSDWERIIRDNGGEV